MRKWWDLGDDAVLVDCSDDADAAALAQLIRRDAPAWIVDLVCSYRSVAIFFDPERVTWASVAEYLQSPQTDESLSENARRLHQIPCCYERQLDMVRVTSHAGISIDEVIHLHTCQDFTIYAIGFCPGFPYLGYLPTQLSGVPRLDRPRLVVEPGSVALTGHQTGIYPLARPGGWNIIGQTPLILADPEDEFFPLQVGDRIRFVRITESEFRSLHGERLAVSAIRG